MPGMFCEAMVTMKSGSAMPMIPAVENAGATSTGSGHSEPKAAGDSCEVATISPTVTSTAAGTA